MKKKSVWAVCALIGLCFLLTGSEYISWWLYKLPSVFDSAAVDALSEGVGYVFQALGVAAFSLFTRRRAKAALSRPTFAAVAAADGLATALAFVSSGAGGILVFGLLMNLLHGVLGGYYLTRLSQCVPQQRRGLVFGLAYAFGSVGSWLLSLPMGGAFLGSPFVFLAYAGMIAAACWLDRFAAPDSSMEVGTAAPTHFSRAILPLAAAVVVLLSVVKGLGFYFPSVDFLDGGVSAVATRAFYAVGLLAAGVVNDKRRKWGAVCCLAALVFPFLALGLSGERSVGAMLWIAGYIFFGFFSVYRVVTFADLSGKRPELLPVAGFGLLFGRLGDAAGAFGGIWMGGRLPVLLAVTSVLFVATVLLFFKYYNQTYASALPQELNTQALLLQFERRYALSARETDVFRLIVRSRSNSEIASDLYISESTVKFHVKNILKKTACANRTELIAAYNRP